jgi:hypothetical protein
LPLLSASGETTPRSAENELETGLRQLWRLRLIDARSFSSPSSRALAVHPLIADTNRVHLATSADVDTALVRHTSTHLLLNALQPLDCDEPAHWPRYRLLAPHLHALFKTVAPHLDKADLGALVTTTAWAACAHDRSGAVSAGERLSRATFDALQILGDNDPATLLVREMFAWETATQGQPEQAEAIYRDILTRRARLHGHDDPATLRCRHELAWVTAIQRRWTYAEAIYKDVLDRRERVLGNEHPDTLMTRHELAWAIASQGRGREAEILIHAVIEDRARVLGPDHPRTMTSRHELAWTIAVQGRWPEAENVYRDVLAIRHRFLGIDHPDALTTRHELAWTIAMQGRRHEARDEYKRTLAARGRVLGPDHPDTQATKQALDRLRAGKTTPADHFA